MGAAAMEWSKSKVSQAACPNIVSTDRCEKEFSFIFSSVLREFMLLWVNIRVNCMHSHSCWLGSN